MSIRLNGCHLRHQFFTIKMILYRDSFLTPKSPHPYTTTALHDFATCTKSVVRSLRTPLVKLKLLREKESIVENGRTVGVERGLPYMTSAKISNFLPPPRPQINATFLTKVAYYVCF